MRSTKSRKELEKRNGNWKLPSVMQCLCYGEEVRIRKMLPLTEPISEGQKRLDTVDIDEAESSLRGNGALNYEEARALLGRYEYQKGNIEAALHVFEGIDVKALTPKIKLTLARIGDHHRRLSQCDSPSSMSIRAVSLVFEAMFLKAKSLQSLGKFEEGAQSCKVILDIVESSLPDGLPEKFGAESKLQETLVRTVELLPELWKFSGCPSEAFLAYRQALLYSWNLDIETASRIQKEFSIYLLYSGAEAIPPSLRSQMNTAFVPRSNLEEAILLLMLLLIKMTSSIIEWDLSIVDHLSFALNMCNETEALVQVIEALPSGIVERKEMYYTLSLCYYADGDVVAALNLLKKLLHHSEDPNHILGLIMASKICSEIPGLAQEGVSYARRALEIKEDTCCCTVGLTNCLLGVSLSEYARSAMSESERVTRQLEAIQALETSRNLTNLRDPNVVYHLSLQHAEQRKLDVALYYAKKLLKLEGGTNHKGWLLLARILSGQKRFVDAETIIDAALEQTGRWDQGALLRTKAKLQVAQGHIKKSIETYTQLLGVLQTKSKTFRSTKELHKSLGHYDKQLELETWLDLVSVYISLSKWGDAEVCLSKVKELNPSSASTWHAIGSLREAKGLYKEAVDALTVALDINPTHVPSLISIAMLLRRLSTKEKSIPRSYLMNALKLDRMNHVAWYNLGLLYESEGVLFEAADCFEAATSLEETAPVEPFR